MSGVGCMIGPQMVNLLAYTDDLVLLAPSWRAMQHLLSVLHSEICSLDLTCNKKKYVFMVCIYAKNNNNNRFTVLCRGLFGWAGTRRNIHPPSWSSSSLYQLLPSTTIHTILPVQITWRQSFCTTSLHVFFGLPLGLEPSTSYSIHFFTQSVSSFHSICPYHRNLFCCSINIIHWVA